jgi:tRNA threonylcarbamoyladenosine biosynthesis protein TsaE
MGSEFQVSSFKLHITSHSFEETQELGENIGTLISDTTLLALTGELGSGKTAFVQGLASGLEVPQEYYITSPSFTLINEYPGRMRLFHVDLYRLENYTDLEETGLYDILEGDGVVAVEWAEKLPEDLLSTHIAIGFNIIDDKTREINLIAYGHDAVGLIKALKHKKDRAISLEG